MTRQPTRSRCPHPFTHTKIATHGTARTNARTLREVVERSTHTHLPHLPTQRTLREVVEGHPALPVLVRGHVPIVPAAVVGHGVVPVRGEVHAGEEGRLLGGGVGGFWLSQWGGGVLVGLGGSVGVGGGGTHGGKQMLHHGGG